MEEDRLKRDKRLGMDMDGAVSIRSTEKKTSGKRMIDFCVAAPFRPTSYMHDRSSFGREITLITSPASRSPLISLILAEMADQALDPQT